MPDPLPFASRLAVPVIAAPMTAVSGEELVLAACRAGVVGAFPAHNADSTAEFSRWMDRFADELDATAAPWAPNLVMHRSNRRLPEDLAAIVARRVELVITSVGSPRDVVGPLHDAGTLVYADVASLQHAQRAIEAGVDGLVLLGAGAGGQTGWVNPFAFVRAVRARFDGTIVLAGGLTDGTSIRAAEVLGVDLGYLGTRFIATRESLASPAYREALVAAELDDVVLSNAVGGIPASLLRVWLETHEVEPAAGEGYAQERLERNRLAWSAGHSVSGVRTVQDVAALVAEVAAEYRAASMRG